MKKLFLLLFVISWFGLLNGAEERRSIGERPYEVKAKICGACLDKWKKILSTSETLCDTCTGLNCRKSRDPRSKSVTVKVKQTLTPGGSRRIEERSLIASPTTMATIIASADSLRPPSLNDDDDSDDDYILSQSLAPSSSSSSSPARHSPRLVSKRKSSSSSPRSPSSPPPKKKRKKSK